MIETIGYIAIYLFIGWVLSPIEKEIERRFSEIRGHLGKTFFIIAWPVALISTLFFIWIRGLIND